MTVMTLWVPSDPCEVLVWKIFLKGVHNDVRTRMGTIMLPALLGHVFVLDLPRVLTHLTESCAIMRKTSNSVG